MSRPVPRPLVRHLIPLVVAVLTASCDGRLLLPSVETTVDFAAARAKWSAQRPSRYEYTLQRICYCRETRPMRVTVRDGRVESVRPEGELLPLTGPEAQWYPSIEGLFDLIASARAMPAHSVVAAFDKDRGFPHSIAIDYWRDTVDDEVTYLVTDIRVP